MSFKPFKSLKKIGKKVFRAGKKIVKGVGKVFKSAFKEIKRFAKSDLGKMVIAGALIYFGGAAIAGQLGSATSTAAATTGTSTIAGAGTAVAAPAATTAVSAAPVAAAASPLAAPVAAGTGPSLASVGGNNLVVPQLLTPAQIAAADASATAPGLMSKLASGVAERPGLAMMGGGQILSAMTAPDADAGADAIALEKWRRKNSNIAGVGGDGSGQPIGSARRNIAKDATRTNLESSTRRYV